MFFKSHPIPPHPTHHRPAPPGPALPSPLAAPQAARVAGCLQVGLPRHVPPEHVVAGQHHVSSSQLGGRHHLRWRGGSGSSGQGWGQGQGQ